MRRTDSCYRVKIRHGAIYRFEVRRVSLTYLDGVVHNMAKGIFQLEQDCVLVACITHRQAKTCCLNPSIKDNGVLSVSPCRKNGQRISEGVGFNAATFHQYILRIDRIIERTVYRRACG